MKSLSPKKLILIGFIVVLLIAIPLTIFFLQQQQDTQSQAEQATTLSFEPVSTQTTPITAQTGEDVRLDVVVDPGVNQNLVSFVRLEIQYDPSKLAPVEETDEIKPFQENTAALTLLEGPVITPGSITATLSVGVDPTKVIQTKTNIAAINFVAVAPTGDTPTEVTFITSSQVLSAGTGDQANENVLASTIPAYIAISGEAEVTPSVSVTPGEEGEATPTPSTVATISPTSEASVTPTVTGTTGSSSNVSPICEGISAAGATSGTAPFAVTLNALGSDSDGTISRATFSFGDGSVQSVTTGGGLGTAAADVSVTHTYQTAGTYQAAVVFTDNNSSVSSGSCTLNITVTDSSSSSSTTTSPTATPIPDSTLPDTGPEDLLAIIGVATTVFIIAGAVIFFAL